MKFLKPILIFFPFALIGYAVFVEPQQLDITSHQVTLGIPTKHLRIAHVTDLHTKGLGSVERQLIKTIREQKPDLIVITGDLTTPGGTPKGYEDVLSQMKAPLGVYFVQGNWEYWEPEKELAGIFRRQGITDLTNKNLKLNDVIWLAGLDDELAGSPDISVLQEIPKSKKVISLFHSPALFNSIFDQVDLAFAGHSHGGQIRLPFLGPFWTPEGTEGYDAGWFPKGRGRMYVSRGIGNSILPVRFNCKPEVAFIKVQY
jgi:predicted MPP superfamily phosphohydrolase